MGASHVPEGPAPGRSMAYIQGRRDAAEAVSELRDEILAKFDDSTTQQALKSIANDWLSQARRVARG